MSEFKPTGLLSLPGLDVPTLRIIGANSKNRIMGKRKCTTLIQSMELASQETAWTVQLVDLVPKLDMTT